MKNLFIAMLLLVGTSTFANEINVKKDGKKNEKSTSIVLNKKAAEKKGYPEGWYTVSCTAGGSFTGHWGCGEGIYGWAAGICDSLN